MARPPTNRRRPDDRNDPTEHLTALSVARPSWPLAACAPSSSLHRRHRLRRVAAARASPSRCGPGGPRTSRRTTRSSTSTRRPTRGVTVDFKAFKNTEYNQILTTGLAGVERPRRRRRCAPTASCSPRSPASSLVPLDGKVDLSRLGRQRRQERQGQGGRQALRRPARPADAPDVLQQGPLRQAGPEAADDVGRSSSRSTPSSRSTASRRWPSAPRTRGRCRSCTRCWPRPASAARLREGRAERPEDLHRPRLGRLRRTR